MNQDVNIVIGVVVAIYIVAFISYAIYVNNQDSKNKTPFKKDIK